MLTTLLHPLLALRGWEAYLIVGVLCFGEAAAFLGFVLPGETAVVYGGILAADHHVSIVWMTVLVVCCAIIGDTVGYAVGHFFGPFILSHRPLRGHPGVVRTTEFVQRRGAIAVFIGRFTAIFRALVPGISGVSGMPYRVFVVANVLGGMTWGILFSLLGYEIGARVLSAAGTVSTVIISIAVFLLVVFVTYRRVKERQKRRQERHDSNS